MGYGQWADSDRRLTLTSGWPATRTRILARDGHTCVQCGRRATDVDHTVPAYLGGTDADDNLRSLCNECHARKSSSEGHAAMRQARARTRRKLPPHPGVIE
jgi:5-methylcytosine-specific restriction protein A